jgi:hypothetical protein
LASERETIIDQIEEEGYCLSYDKIDIPSLARFSLKVYTLSYAYDKQNFDDAHVSDICDEDEQDEWFRELYTSWIEPNDDTFCDYVEKDWRFSDWDDPARRKGYHIMYLYFDKEKNHSLKELGIPLKVIVDGGCVLKCEKGKYYDDTRSEEYENDIDSLFFIPPPPHPPSPL